MSPPVTSRGTTRLRSPISANAAWALVAAVCATAAAADPARRDVFKLRLKSDMVMGAAGDRKIAVGPVERIAEHEVENSWIPFLDVLIKEVKRAWPRHYSDNATHKHITGTK